MSQIREWLARLDLERYADIFVEHEVDAETLDALDDSDLVEMGLPLGPRRKILTAIAKERDAAASRRSGHGERRQLTVAFCDLVGSTELATTLDPEELVAIINAYKECCARVTRSHGGVVAQFLGDGALAYFGYPVASEHAPAQAVLASLEIVREVAAIEIGGGPPLRTRIGIATGEVVIGERFRAGIADEQPATGETPNLAARLQALAAPNSVVVAPATRRLIGGQFDVRALAGVDLKGFPGMNEVFLVERERATNRFAARHTSERLGDNQLPPMRGRGSELDALRMHALAAANGEFRLCTLAGEAGVGKSRIVLEAIETAARNGMQSIVLHASPTHQASPLYPVTEHLRLRGEFSPGDSPAQVTTKLERLDVGAVSDDPNALALLASMLDLDTGNAFAEPDLPPAQKRQRTLRLLADAVIAMAGNQPVLLAIEDAHWLDPTTLELLAEVARNADGAALWMVAAFRPEFDAAALGRTAHLHVSLERLDDAASRALIDDLVRGKAMPAEVTDALVERADGVPLFLEELLQLVLDSEQLKDTGERFELKQRGFAARIPATLQDSLMARLDRLGHAKEIAQLGALLGRRFSIAMLSALVAQGALAETAKVGVSLETLEQAELIRPVSTSGTDEFEFKHALVQETAYNSILRSERVSHHSLAASVLEQQFPELCDAQPETLAHHLQAAQQVPDAVRAWLQAGQRAFLRSALEEALVHFNRALELVAGLPDARDTRELELEVYTRLGPALLAAKGFGASEVEAAYARARALCDETGDSPKLFPVLRGLWAFYYVRARLSEADVAGLQLLKISETERDTLRQIESHRSIGSTLIFRAEFTRARTHLNAAYRLYRPDAHAEHISAFGTDPGATCVSYLSYVDLLEGKAVDAKQRSQEAVASARALDHPFTLAQTLAFDAYVHGVLREWPQARTSANEAAAISAQHGFPFWWVLGTLIGGWADASLGESSGFDQVTGALAKYRGSGCRLLCTHFLCVVAELELARGNTEAASTAIDEGMALAEQTGESYFAAELERVGARIDREAGRHERAAGRVQRALATANAQGTRLFALRAACDLLTFEPPASAPSVGHVTGHMTGNDLRYDSLERDGHPEREALDCLESVLAQGAPDDQTPDIVAARKVLQALQETGFTGT